MDTLCNVWSRTGGRSLQTSLTLFFFSITAVSLYPHTARSTTSPSPLALSGLSKTGSCLVCSLQPPFLCKVSILQVSLGFFSLLCSKCSQQNQLQPYNQTENNLGLEYIFGISYSIQTYFKKRKKTKKPRRTFSLSTTAQGKAPSVSIILYFNLWDISFWSLKPSTCSTCPKKSSTFASEESLLIIYYFFSKTESPRSLGGQNPEVTGILQLTPLCPTCHLFLPAGVTFKYF